ncbi:ABC transporter ATP-binding protein [Microbacterium sp. NPDC058389]|uniref:ABC transporter ATP-binding protein n=1 Tax=Microbacterium sp. NPDC058389 TaxID=3346475 RepID=UPI003656071E
MRVVVDSVSVVLGGRPVLDSVSTTFRGREVVALMGPSGAGKSTLLAAIAGAVPATSGAVSFEDASPDDVEWLMQATPLLQRRRVIDNVALSSELRGLEQDVARMRAVRAMRTVGVLPLARTHAFRLSGGEKQRVAVARAMSARAATLLADEPTAALDADNRRLVVDALHQAARAGALVIIATHDEHVASACDRILDVVDGQLAERSR